jgi:hypothetical protein
VAGSLYVGREIDPVSAARGDRLELDPADLLTHGLIVGMTGSGKTGLAIVLIEEVLRQGVPVLAIDPKGDLGNLLLLFDGLDAASFSPWVDPEAARRAGGSTESLGRDAAAAWSRGLAEWGLAAADVADLERRREAVIYTPGSTSGVPLNLLQSLDAPPFPFESAAEDLRDEIAGIVSGLLGLVGVDADPIQSREHILLASLIESAWRDGRSLSLEALLTSVAAPPFERLGALPLETAFPAKERRGLMMSLNNLVASPSFQDFRRGEPMDVARLLRGSDGRPRLAIVHTAHLSDPERSFVTALLLDKVKTWMRRQSGTSELRALVYMDEVFGYFPPHPANPPTKRPLLTLLKQARAQGVGVVLATQNPVDLDYKGLANMGAWAVGTLQADQDRDRLKDGLVGSGADARGVEGLLGKTRKRVFLLHDVHRKGLTLFETRWALSYLRGPLTGEEIGRLMSTVAAAAVTRDPSGPEPAGPPPLPVPLRSHYWKKYGGELAEPHLFVKYAVRYKGTEERVAARAYPLAAASAAEVLDGEPVEVDEAQLSEQPPADLRYGDLPAFVVEAGARGLEKALRERLPSKLAVTVFEDPVTKARSVPGESRDALAARIRSEELGAAASRLGERIERKRRDLAVRQEELAGRKTEKWTAIGSAILSNIGLLTGRKRRISGTGSVLTKNRLENTAEARVEALRAEITELEAELQEVTAVDPERFLEERVVPARGDVKLLRLDVLWLC